MKIHIEEKCWAKAKASLQLTHFETYERSISRPLRRIVSITTFQKRISCNITHHTYMKQNAFWDPQLDFDSFSRRERKREWIMKNEKSIILWNMTSFYGLGRSVVTLKFCHCWFQVEISRLRKWSVIPDSHNPNHHHCTSKILNLLEARWFS